MDGSGPPSAEAEPSDLSGRGPIPNLGGLFDGLVELSQLLHHQHVLISVQRVLDVVSHTYTIGTYSDIFSCTANLYCDITRAAHSSHRQHRSNTYVQTLDK